MKDTLEHICVCNNAAYSDIDKCIDKIVLSRLHNKKEDEARAIFQMESMMVRVLEHLSWVNQELQQIIKKER